MPRRRTEPDDPPNEPERLLVPLEQARSVIGELVQEGEALIQQDIEYTEAGIDGFRGKKKVWADYAATALRRTFAPAGVAEAFRDAAEVHVGRIGASMPERHGWMQDAIQRGIVELTSLARRAELMPQAAPAPALGRTAVVGSAPQKSSRVFVVHGHDETMTLKVTDVLRRLGLEPVVLKEEPDRGQTLLDKFEAHADASYAVVLLMADDEARIRGASSDLVPRARQNVILEHGYFLARLGRNRVTALRATGVEVPSDLGGILYKEVDAAGAWQLALAKELRAAGFPVDFNRL